MMSKEPHYPNVYCSGHDKTGPGYMICEHITGPTDVALLELASTTNLGFICCKVCEPFGTDKDYVLAHFALGCAEGVQEMGIILELN